MGNTLVEPKEDGNNAYSQWIFCDTCNQAILMNVDSERHYGVVNHMLRRTGKTDVPVEWGHITQGDTLNHVHSVEYDGVNYKYNQDTMPITPCEKP
jgi:hypothetical protein